MNQIDLLFIVDITGSMGSFIEDAKNRMQTMLSELSEKFEIDLKVGLSLYRDHSSQGDAFTVITFDLMDTKDVKDKISQISVGGGGDEPEAVLDGIIQGITEMKWRENSKRIAFLIGDAPAHGMVSGEECCQCGKTYGDAINAAETQRISIYSIVLGNPQMTEDNFKLISNFTGGILIKNKDAMEAIIETLTSKFDELNLDSQVLELMSKKISQEEICRMLSIKREKIEESMMRI